MVVKRNLSQELSEQAAVARAQVLKQGLELPDRPELERPRLLDVDLTSLGDEELADLLVQYTAWKNYAGYQLALAEIDESVAEEVAATAEAVAMVRDWGGTNQRVAMAKAQRAADPDVIARKEKQAAAYAYRKLSQVVYSSIENDLFAVSREITRRNGGDPKARRSERYSK